jgi:hypothetical protein
METASIVTSYPIIVDYSMNIDDLYEKMKMFGFVYVDPYIGNSNFPPRKKNNIEKLNFHIIQIKERKIYNKEAVRLIKEMGYRPAKIRDLIAFLQQYPDFRFKKGLVAPAELWKWSYTFFAPCFLYHERNEGKSIALFPIKGGWNENFCFAATSKFK